MTSRTYGQPSLLASYTSSMLPRVGRSRSQLDGYRSAIAAFNAAPNETGFVIPDRSGAVAGDLDQLETVDRGPEVLATALQSADVTRWSSPLLSSVTTLQMLADGLPAGIHRSDVLTLQRTELDRVIELLRDAADMSPDELAERSDEIAEAFAWIAEQGESNPDILHEAFGDWGPGEVESLLANLSHYATTDGLHGPAPQDPEMVEQLLDPVARALGAATEADALSPAAVTALTGGGFCRDSFNGFDDGFHTAQGRMLLLGHADEFTGEVAADLAHHAIAAEPALVDLYEEELGGFGGGISTPATLYLDHRFDARLAELQGADDPSERPPMVQDLSTYALLAVEDWGGSDPNEAAFHFTTRMRRGAAYEQLVGDDVVHSEVAGNIIAEGLGRYPTHAGAAASEAARETLTSWVETFAAADHGRFYSMDDEIRQGLAVAVASDPDTLTYLTHTGDVLDETGQLMVELMRDDTAVRILLDGGHALQGDRLAQVLEAHVPEDGEVDLSERLDADLHTELTEVGRVYEKLDLWAEQAGVADELRGDIATGATSVLLGLVPKGPKAAVEGGQLVVDFMQLEGELDSLADDRAEGIDRERGAQLLLLTHAAEQQPELLEANLTDAQRDALDDALSHEEPAARQDALERVWVHDLEGTDLKRQMEYLVEHTH